MGTLISGLVYGVVLFSALGVILYVVMLGLACHSVSRHFKNIMDIVILAHYVFLAATKLACARKFISDETYYGNIYGFGGIYKSDGIFLIEKAVGCTVTIIYDIIGTIQKINLGYTRRTCILREKMFDILENIT